jgi:LPXTG-motif cell wall-anchored protein
VLIAMLFIAASILCSKLRNSSESETESKEVKLFFWFLLLQVVVMLLSLMWPRVASGSYNCILLLQVLGFMYLGFLRHSEGVFRVCIAVFFLDILSRYFDIFWGMMPRSLLFIFGGLLLIAGAILVNRKRKEIEKKMVPV